MKSRRATRAWLACVCVLALVGGAMPVRADPASLIQTLMVVDQGNFMSFHWSFYFVDFPRRFELQGDPSQTVVLDDPATLDENLGKIVAQAFDLRIDGQPVRPDRISPLAISPNKVCTVTMIYRGRPGAKVELRAPVLRYLPPAALINYEILPLNQTRNLLAGNLTARAGPFAQAVVFRETGDAHAPAPSLESPIFAAFKSGQRATWVNANWILLSVILLLVLEPARALGLLAVIGVGWTGVEVFGAGNNERLAGRIPDLAAGLVVALVAIAAARGWSRTTLLVLATGAALVNAVGDLQQPGRSTGDGTIPAMAGLGFAASLLLVGAVLAVLVAECRKFHEFEPVWVPRICWLIAPLALVLAL